MVVEDFAQLPMAPWLIDALVDWLLVVGCLAGGAVLIGWLVSAMRHGPASAVRTSGRMLANAAADLGLMSPRRVWALSWLAVKESVRRRAVVVFALFILILLFAGWFLDPGSDHPARLYLSFVLTATTYLVLLLVLFLSSLSLPGDIKQKTLHTVVTKPVRQSEIVLGRIVGFTLVGTCLLIVMGAVSYVFVIRGLSHGHQIEEAELQRAWKTWQRQYAEGKPLTPVELQTSKTHNHRHTVYVEPIPDASAETPPGQPVEVQGRLRTEMEQGHWHELSYKLRLGRSEAKDRADIACSIGPARGRLIARVPVYGKLRFRDRSGREAEKGVNVGDEWTYRSFIEGGTPAAAIWTFEGITEERFPEDQFPYGLPVEMTIEVFRTYKGDTSDEEEIPAIPGSLSVRNPGTGQMVEANIFPAKDFAIDVQYIRRELTGPDGRRLDLFRDLSHDGRMEIWLRCIERAQYFGVAQADLYLRARDASFTLNFIKGYGGIWLQMVLLIGVGVMFSTFLSGPIAMLATLGALVGGLFSQFMSRLARGEVVGGGPFEAFIRLLTQQNVVSDMEPGLRTSVAKMLDKVAEAGLRVAASLLPEFARFSFATHVAYGFDISLDAMARGALSAFGFLLPAFVAGYLFLKTREVAR